MKCRFLSRFEELLRHELVIGNTLKPSEWQKQLKNKTPRQINSKRQKKLNILGIKKCEKNNSNFNKELLLKMTKASTSSIEDFKVCKVNGEDFTISTMIFDIFEEVFNGNKVVLSKKLMKQAIYPRLVMRLFNLKLKEENEAALTEMPLEKAQNAVLQSYERVDKSSYRFNSLDSRNNYVQLMEIGSSSFRGNKTRPFM